MYEKQDLALSDLPEYTAEQVRNAITVDDLAAARDKVDRAAHPGLPDRHARRPTPTPSATATATATDGADRQPDRDGRGDGTADATADGQHDADAQHHADPEHHAGTGRDRLRERRLMATVTTVVPRTRRGVELVLLVFAVGIVLVAYANVGLAVDGELPPSMLTLRHRADRAGRRRCT